LPLPIGVSRCSLSAEYGIKPPQKAVEINIANLQVFLSCYGILGYNFICSFLNLGNSLIAGALNTIIINYAHSTVATREAIRAVKSLREACMVYGKYKNGNNKM